jgi:hypothetical protein
MRRNVWPAFIVSLAGFSAAGCSDRPAPLESIDTVDDLRVTLRVDDDADRVTINLEIRNLGSSTRTVRFPATCNPTIEFHANSSNSGQPVWNERSWREGTMSCLPVVRNADLISGGAIGTRYAIMDGMVLGDSLVAGTYRLTLHFALQQPDTVLELSGGTVRLEK